MVKSDRSSIDDLVRLPAVWAHRETIKNKSIYFIQTTHDKYFEKSV